MAEGTIATKHNENETINNVIKNKEIVLKKINDRSENVKAVGYKRNNAYLLYLKAGRSYDILKKGFYAAVEVAMVDKNISETEIEVARRMVKRIDQEFLKEIKTNSYKVQEINLENLYGSFKDRIVNIKAAGFERNKLFFEFSDEKMNFKIALNGFHKELFLAVTDGFLNDIEKIIYEEPINCFEKHLSKEMKQQKKEVCKKCEHENSNNRAKYEQYGQGGIKFENSGYIRRQGAAVRGQGRYVRGQGKAIRGLGGSNRGVAATNLGRTGGYRGRARGSRQQTTTSRGQIGRIHRSRPY